MSTNTYTPTIGLEIHAELKTRTKMFCNSRNAPHESEPNTHVCPICMGHPGTLPTINKRAVQYVLLVGHALGGALADYTEFDRKNYFYPDIPKGYQISQYEYPLVRGGSLADVAITRVHLEEDTARSLHDKGSESIVDFNRAGVPLMELVTEPVIHDSKTAVIFAKELQLLLKTLKVSDANMERGEMRVEANISVSTGTQLGTKVEVKNLNSFRSLEAAIAYEIKRQVDLLEKGEDVVQETRGWDENAGKTFSQRKKESSHDYRYFPDPDLPKLKLSLVEEFSVSRLSEITPKLATEKRDEYAKLGLSEDQIEILVSNLSLGDYFERTIETKKSTDNDQKFAKMAANYITSDIVGQISSRAEISIEDASPENFVALLTMLEEGMINSRVAKDLIFEAVFEHKDPEKLARERNLTQSNNTEELRPIVEKIITEHADVVEDYKKGKEASIQFLVGQGMRETKGAANPTTLLKLIKEQIE